MQFGNNCMQQMSRKRLLLRSSCQDIRNEGTDPHHYEREEQTVRMIDQMLANIRTLLHKTKINKEELEKTVDQENLAALQAKIEEFRKIQKQLQNPYFCKTPLDQSMAGAFVMRLCKQMTYLTPCLPFMINLIGETDEMFCEQRNNNQLNIELLYFKTIKKINNKADQMIKILYKKVLKEFSPEEVELSEKERENLETLDPFSLLYLEQKLNLEKSEEMKKLANNMINTTYGGLDLVSLEPFRLYKVQRGEAYNLEYLFEQQIKRNKKISQQIKEYRKCYETYRYKKIHTHLRLQESEKRKTSTSKKTLHSLSSNSKKIHLPALGPSCINYLKPKSVSLIKSKSRVRSQENKVIRQEESNVKLKNMLRKEKTNTKQYRLKL